MRKITLLIIPLLGLPCALAAAPAKRTLVYQAESAHINPKRAEIVEQASFKDGRGVALKDGMPAVGPTNDTPPDLIFSINEPTAGRFVLRTYAAVDDAGAEQMRRASSKHHSLFADIQIDARRPTRRVVFVPWSAPELCTQVLGIFDLTNGTQSIKFWLPPHVRLDRLEVHPYRAPAVPKEAAAYRPPVQPPSGHPRLWVTSNTLANVRARLAHPEHAAQWRSVRGLATKPLKVSFPDDAEMSYNTALERAVAAKAFVWLMTDDKQHGLEAVRLMREYLSRVSFGNLLDITRETGAATYTAALVYDWCYALCTPADRAILRRHMMRLAEEMECGWPPFKGLIVNGHGNEAMINRDLLAMGIALYDEDPVPYRYCAYRVLEELVPMRRFEYQSPRHNQGVSYATYRFGWEMHAAWLFLRMSGKEVFDPNIKTVPLYWLNMRLPNLEMLRDGDGVPSGRYSFAQTALLCYAYNGDPILKGEFQRQGGKADPLLYLLLNDPTLQPVQGFETLPTTIDFGPVLSSMIARTDWNIDSNINNTVVAEIKGGGYHFGNHQHADVGAIQLYYRGLQVADLGQYGFYGTPYDMNFNKRSIAHSMLLVLDPNEKFLNRPANDGGSRFIQSAPRTPKHLQETPLFHYGRKLACGFGPDALRPSYSYYAADLTAAYSDKVASFTRSFCFLNLGKPSHPACVIVLDDIRTADPSFKKYWQVNTLNPPRRTPRGVQFHNAVNNVTGRVDVCVLRPASNDQTIEIKSGADVYDVFGYRVTPPFPARPEANGHRVLVSPQQARAQDTFLVLMQAHDDAATPLPHTLSETADHMILRIADRIVCLSHGGKLFDGTLDILVPSDGTRYEVVLAGLAAGTWHIAGPQGKTTANCAAGNHTLSFTTTGGACRITNKK